ncbi:hypothetical protein FQN60_006418 [Etheostoma spectabile]|uniref:Uncharacterized protein n=1 Tax=Etheostoma spectabile TaxID=54343 RepID=A0A5J5CM09_9PERO|nr:hypothetical protein FQN60_006418 [Etheostoma spectabile]
MRVPQSLRITIMLGNFLECRLNVVSMSLSARDRLNLNNRTQQVPSTQAILHDQ